MKTILTICIITFSLSCIAQKQNIIDKTPTQEFDNILVEKLYSDENASSFVIWVKNSVKTHKHKTHTETLYVINGKGKMKVGKKKYKISKGDFLVIPKNTFHEVKVTSKTPLKVISIQAPEFLGEDRIFK